MIWELRPFVDIGNDGKQRIVDVAEPVRPPPHTHTSGPGPSCLGGSGSGLLPEFVELSLRKFSFRAREGFLGPRVNALFVLPQPGFEFSARLSNIGRVIGITLILIHTTACLKQERDHVSRGHN